MPLQLGRHKAECLPCRPHSIGCSDSSRPLALRVATPDHMTAASIRPNPTEQSRCSRFDPIRLPALPGQTPSDRKSTRLNSSHSQISYAVFCLKKKKKHMYNHSNII